MEQLNFITNILRIKDKNIIIFKKGENQFGPLQVVTFHQPTTVDKEPEKIGNSTYNREKKTRSENLVFIIIPAAGVEPARPCGHWILSPARLPIPPRRQSITGVAGFEPTHEGVKVPCLTAWLYPNNINNK